MSSKTINHQGQEAALYTSPMAEVLELAAQDVLCVSTPNGTEPYDLENWI